MFAVGLPSSSFEEHAKKCTMYGAHKIDNIAHELCEELCEEVVGEHVMMEDEWRG
jgi:hypothetical protein